jgi:hypothetical protein
MHECPLTDADQHTDMLGKFQDELIAAEIALKAEILDLLKKGDFNAIVYGAPMVNKYGVGGPFHYGKRHQTLLEVMFQPLDFLDNDVFEQVIGALAKSPDAQPLLDRMACEFARLNAFVAEES